MEQKRRKQRAIVYDVVPSGSKSRMRELVEKSFEDTVVVKEYIEKESIVSSYGQMPVLGQMLTDIIRGDVKADAVFIKSLRIFRSSEPLLFLKRILELRGMKLLSLTSKDNKILRLSTQELLNRVKLAKIYDIVGYTLLVITTITMWLLIHDIIFTLLFIIVGTIVIVIHYLRGLKARAFTEKKLRELLELKLPPDTRRIRVKVSQFGVKVYYEDRK